MIGKKLRDAMNEQIKHELESYYIYLSMAAYFHSENLDGMAHWMRVQCHEEQVHAMKFFDHIIDRGGQVELLDLKQIKTKWSSPLEAWKDAYEHEKFVTGKINSVELDDGDILGAHIKGEMLASTSATAAITVIMANATDRNWPAS